MNGTVCFGRFLNTAARFLALSLLLLLTLSVAACKSPMGTEGGTTGGPDGVADPAGSGAVTNPPDGNDSDPVGDTEPWSDTEGETLWAEPTEMLFGFSYAVDGGAMRGSEIDINVTLTNLGILYVYNGCSTGLRASVALYCTQADGSRYPIEHAPVADTEDVVTIEFPYGDSRTFTYYGFEIPEDAPSGRYDLVLSFENSEKTVEGIFVLED